MSEDTNANTPAPDEAIVASSTDSNPTEEKRKPFEFEEDDSVTHGFAGFSTGT